MHRKSAAIVSAYGHPSRFAPGYANLRFIAESVRHVLQDAQISIDYRVRRRFEAH